MLLESRNEYDSQWAALSSIAPKIGCTPETLRVWLRHHERDAGAGDGGLTTTEYHPGRSGTGMLRFWLPEFRQNTLQENRGGSTPIVCLFYKKMPSMRRANAREARA